MDYSGLLSQIAPTTIQQAQGQQLQQQLQANQAQNQAIQAQSAQQELASKKRGMSLSILNGLSTLDPSKAQDLYPTFKGMAERIDPTMQLPDDYDPTMLKALMPSQIPITSMPEYQMNTAKGAFYRTLADQAAGGQGQPAPGMPAGSPTAGGIMPPTGVPSQGVTSAPTGTSLLSQPNIAQGLAIFDPAGSQALTAQQKLQYESPEGKQAAAQAEKTGQNIADVNKGVAGIDSRLQNAISILNDQIKLAPATYSGKVGEYQLERQRDLANFGIKTQGPSDQTQFEQNNANLFTQELPAIISGMPGSRLDIPLVNAIKKASQINEYGTPEEKIAAAQNLKGLLYKLQQNTHNNAKEMGAPPLPIPPIDDPNPPTPLQPQTALQQAQAMLPKPANAATSPGKNAAPDGTVIHDGKGTVFIKRGGQWVKP